VVLVLGVLLVGAVDLAAVLVFGWILRNTDPWPDEAWLPATKRCSESDGSREDPGTT
jgi:hypothetical protein